MCHSSVASMVFNKPPQISVAFSSNQIACEAAGLLGRSADLDWMCSSVQLVMGQLSNGSSPIMGLASLTGVWWSVGWLSAGLGWPQLGGRTGAPCVSSCSRLAQACSQLWWRVKSKPQGASAFQASACIVFAHDSLAHSQRVWQIEDLKNRGSQPAIYCKEREGYKIIFILLSAIFYGW